MQLPDVKEIEAYIREVATQVGINPDVAVRVAKSEGLAPGQWQSNLKRPDGSREKSYGPFQLFEGGGLGNKFKDMYGVSASDPSTWKQQVQFALNEAKRGGWTPWYGAKNSGIGAFEGIRPGASSPGTQMAGPNRGLDQAPPPSYSPSQGPGDAVAQKAPMTMKERVSSGASGLGDAMSSFAAPQAAPVGPMGGTTGYAPMQLPMTHYLADAASKLDPSLLRKLGLI